MPTGSSTSVASASRDDLDAGVGGFAVGVHATQFAIR